MIMQGHIHTHSGWLLGAGHPHGMGVCVMCVIQNAVRLSIAHSRWCAGSE